jgi:hypothetical protein
MFSGRNSQLELAPTPEDDVNRQRPTPLVKHPKRHFRCHLPHHVQLYHPCLQSSYTLADRYLSHSTRIQLAWLANRDVSPSCGRAESGPII